MSVKKNFVYSGVLLVSQYIIPIAIFPYISRVFGVETIGIVNWVDSTVNYFILISMMGMTLMGVRATAKYKKNKNELNVVFSELVILHLLSTLIVLFVYVIIVNKYEKFSLHSNLFYIGILKIVSNVFLIEWFFRGTENFKFITIRSIFIKIIYLISIFLFVKEKEDYNIYFVLTCGVIVLNAIVNCWYAKSIVSFTFYNLNLGKHIRPFFTLGVYMVLTSMYTSFNVTYLGIVSNDVAVGAYTTALKLYTVILGLFTALNSVLIPRISSLVNEENLIEFRSLIHKSINVITTFSFPIIICNEVLAREIINLIAGHGYEKAITCYRIIMPLLFVVGFAQILSYLILIPLKKESKLAIISFIGALVGFILNIALVSRLHEVGSSIVVLISEITVSIILYFLCDSFMKLEIDFLVLIKQLVVAVPYVFICYFSKVILNKDINILVIAIFISTIYFIFSQIYLLKNEMINSIFNKLRFIWSILIVKYFKHS